MPYFYKFLLFAISIALPYLAISYRNQFDSALATASRFCLAVIVVWGWLWCSRIFVVYIDVRLAETAEQLEMIYAGDGAKDAAVLFFGWVPGLALASASWCIARLAFCFREGRLGNTA